MAEITAHDEITYEKIIGSLPTSAQRKLREIAIQRRVHIATVVKEAIVSFAAKRQKLKTA